MNWDHELKAAADRAASAQSTCSVALPGLISARELQQKDFPPVSWIVRDLIPEGLTLLAGKPKLGKSWLALQVGIAVATGNEALGRPAAHGKVLYAAMEDNHRRLKSRLAKSSDPSSDWPTDLIFTTECPRLDLKGLDAIEDWINNHPSAKLVIIDTLATVRPAGNAKDGQYLSDYNALRGLHELANRQRIAVVVIHHVRKADADDPFDTVSGSTGLTGAADTTLVLTNTSEGKVLYGRGRDLAELEIAVSFDLQTCLWSDLGRPYDAYGSETRKAIREALRAGKITPTDIAQHADLEYDLCAKTLQRMAEGGEIEKGGRGRYRLTPDPLS